MKAGQTIAAQIAKVYEHPRSLVDRTNERFAALFASPTRLFAWKPIKTEDAGWVWMREAWRMGGRVYSVKPAVKPVTIFSRPFRIPFRVQQQEKSL